VDRCGNRSALQCVLTRHLNDCGLRIAKTTAVITRSQIDAGIGCEWAC
jgi:hypothetical protein